VREESRCISDCATVLTRSDISFFLSANRYICECIFFGEVGEWEICT
jgi:hypothetical protein